jgi:two-component system, cell cycle sensor histidine kinase and response regulator CckA
MKMDTIIIPSNQTNLPETGVTNKPLRALIADDSENDALLVLRELRKAGYELVYERVSTAPAMQAALGRQTWDVIISDYEMPHFGGFEALQLVKASGHDLPFILVSAVVSEETAVAAMKAGAHDFIMKRKLARLAPAIERELREAQTRLARKAAEAALRQSEDQLRQTQKMEAVGRLAASVAHDFNNILTSILCHGEMLLKQLPAGDPCRKNAEQIEKCAHIAATLTKQLLTYSRKQVIAPRILELNVVILNIEQILRRFIVNGIEFEIALDPNIGRVQADPGQIEQVLINLVVNACDAMGVVGKLTLTTTNFTLNGQQAKGFHDLHAGDYVLLAIADTGTGMTDEVKAHLFEPFFTTKPPGKGTGLGLATCFSIAKQSNAHIQVESELGKGTTFKIYFPQVPKLLVNPLPDLPAEMPEEISR